MLRKGHILAISVIVVSFVTVLSIDAQQDLSIPQWVKNNALWWGQGDISDADFISGINFLIENNHVSVPSSAVDEQREYSQKLQSKIIALEAENQRLQEEIESLEDLLYGGYGTTQPSYDPAPTSGRIQSQDCDGYADCFSGEVTEIIDGDTIKVEGQSIRFALADTPEYGDYGYSQATNFIASICPVGSIALVDEDDMQTQGSYGRTIAVVYCNGMNLNKAVLDQGHAEIDTYFCSKSEFEYHSWAQVHGCEYEEPKYEAPKYVPPPKATPPPESTPPPTPEPSCDPSYPDVCIAPYPPDLNCGDIPYKNFKVVGSDPHGFDGDNDGIGCES